MGALTFSAPLLLGTLILLPGLWWLLRAMPPAPRHTPFGGMIFLDRLSNDRETPARTPWWLLLIRLAALGLLILGLSGPVLGTRTDLDGDGPLLIIVDDSWPAAPRWSERQRVMTSLAVSPGARQRPTSILTTTGEASFGEPMTLKEAAASIRGLTPSALLPDRPAVMKLLEETPPPADIVWITDGVIGRRGADREFLDLLGDADSLLVIRPAGQVTMAIRDLTSRPDGLGVTVERIGSNADGGSVQATAQDGRVLGDASFTFTDSDLATAEFDLPVALRNEIARLTIAGNQSAGATWLTDARARRVRAGIVSDGDGGLLEGGFYIEQALTDHAITARGTLEDQLTEETTMIVLDDVAIVRADLDVRLMNWVADGGTLVRFAGPNTANAAGATGAIRNPSYPVALRGGERAFGGALSWTEPQMIASFPEDSILAGLELQEDIEVRRQVLTRANTEPGYEVWASLPDGTPLVTARDEGDGQLILFHLTSTPTWSDLPVSGLFPAMMGRIAESASDVPAPAPTEALAPYRLLDGFGALMDPGATASPATPEEMASGTAPPGLYGSAASAIAVNTYGENAPTLDPLSAGLLPGNAVIRGESSHDVRSLGPVLIVLALLLMAADAVGLAWRSRMSAAPAAAALLLMPLLMVMSSVPASAQPADLRPEIDARALAASLSVRFAYVESGDPSTDRVTRQGLFGLTREATRRSALEPAPPVSVDIERQDLSVYPLLYWVITPDMQLPSDGALYALETFMADGGLLIIDTRDGERQTEAGETAEGALLRRILLRMNIPPLEPLPGEHILKKSFYRLDDLHGRNTGGPVWVEASSALRESTDGVPSLIIGGRDWASAWAVDQDGRAIRSPGAGGELRREYAYRAGINMAMVALTGNYKEDQVHVQELLDRLGDRP